MTLSSDLGKDRGPSESGWPRAPDTFFVQAGVGGLAAAMAEELAGWMAQPAAIVVVEPETAACVTAALAAGGPVRPLFNWKPPPRCSPAARQRARFFCAFFFFFFFFVLRADGGPATTPSGAASLAGAIAVTADHAMVGRLGLSSDSRLVILVTEGDLEDVPPAIRAP